MKEEGRQYEAEGGLKNRWGSQAICEAGDRR